jgi:tetratricopeptide (TPR) repeat protein
MSITTINRTAYCLAILFCISCSNTSNNDTTAVGSLNLKRGEVVSCGPADGEMFGNVSFTASVPANLQIDFNVAIALLHSFEYDESEKMFAKVIDQAPDCAMAYWGVAMSNFHPLWAPPTEEELAKGAKAVEIARSIENKTARESDYIEAIGKFYENAGTLDHKTRVLNFEKAMEQLYAKHTDDLETSVFYALALNAAADPTDKTYARQKKAVSILYKSFEKYPLHPGLAHYIIHNYDYPALAEMALPAARRYASIAPASAHAQHMPSHIFTRLGLWEECIKSNKVAAASAVCYAEKAGIKGHWDEELHVTDYLVYAYLQRGEDELAKEQVDYLRGMKDVSPQNFKTAYALAASPARYLLEKKMWAQAAALELHPIVPWEKFPWQKAVVHFARVLGSVHTGDIAKANKELDTLRSLHATLKTQKDKTKEIAQLEIQIQTAEAWIQLRQGNNAKAIELMTNAANHEDASEKMPVTPGEVIPARELLGEMLLQLNKPAEALAAFELSLQSHVNRFNSLYGAATAAQLSGDKEKAAAYFKKLLEITNPGSKRLADKNL